MDSRLFKAAQQGDIHELRALLKEDPLALQKVVLIPYADTPLHTATLARRTDFVKELIQQMPAFAWDRNKDGFTPLHIASAVGNISIVKEILKVSPNLCLIKDNGGRTPLHYAAIKGRVNVVNELLSKCPFTAWEVTANGETALHLAELNSQFEAFKLLLEKLSTKDVKFLNSVDNNGNTLLHLAESTKQLQVIYLLRKHGIMNINQSTDQVGVLGEELSSEFITISVERKNRDNKVPDDKGIQPAPSSLVQQHKITPNKQEIKSHGRMSISKGVVPNFAEKENPRAKQVKRIL